MTLAHKLSPHTIPTKLLLLLVTALVLIILGMCSRLYAAPCVPLPTCGTEASAPVVVVQNAYVGAAYAVPATLAFPFPVAAGSTLTVSIRATGHSAHLFSVTDSRGNLYAKAAQLNQTNTSTSLAIYYAVNTTAGPNSVTVSDAAAIGWTRFTIAEFSGLGALSPLTTTGQSDAASLASAVTPGSVGDFVLTTVGTSQAVAFTPGEGGTAITSEDKFLVEYGASTATYMPASNNGVVSVAFVTSGAAVGPCATPTPVISWDQVLDADLAGYSLWYNEPGGVPQKLRDIPCVLEDRSDPPDGLLETRTCLGPDVWIALQRERDFAPFTAYEFRVKAYDALGNVSSEFSDVLPMCFQPLCVKPGPCS